MKQRFFLLLALALLIALAFLPATSFAATSATSGQHHAPHLSVHKDQTWHGVGIARPASSTATDTTFSNVSYHGGPVMFGAVKVYAILWEPTGNVEASYNTLISNFFL